MFRKLFISICTMTCCAVIACSRPPSQEEKVLVSINDLKLKVSDFQRLLAADMETDPDFKLTAGAKKMYLSELIQKEILIQEAKRLELDRKTEFIRTIERYWEATLIRNLMQLKGGEIDKRIIVSQEEVQRRYDAMKVKTEDIQPLTEIEVELRAEIKEQKKTAMFQQWVEELKNDADVDIDEELLDQL